MGDVRTIDVGYMGRRRVAAAFLVQDAGEAAFIETGTVPSLPRLLAALEDEGLKSEQVRYVIITHVHLDHAGGAAALMRACPRATLLAHPRAARHAIDPSRLVASASAVYGTERFQELYGTIEPIAEERVRVVDDGEVLSLGNRELAFLHTRGHANHHFVVHDRAAEGVFTGDSFGIAYPAVQNAGRFVFPSTSPTDFDPVAARESLVRIVETGARRVWLTHFGERTDVREIATDLDGQLEHYEALLERAREVDDEALDAFCEQEVRAIFDGLFTRRPGADTPTGRALVELDIDLNAQGVAFAVRRARSRQRG